MWSASLCLLLGLISSFTRGSSADSAWSLPPCAHDCEGIGDIDWSSDRATCAYFERRGFGCLEDCANDALKMDGVGVKDFPKVCHWQLLECSDLLYSKNPLAEGDSFCPEICEHRECLRAYESLLSSKRHLDLHRRCAKNCH